MDAHVSPPSRLGKHLDDTIAVSAYDHRVRHFGHNHAGDSVHVIAHQVLLLLDAVRAAGIAGCVVPGRERRPGRRPALDLRELEMELDILNGVGANIGRSQQRCIRSFCLQREAYLYRGRGSSGSNPSTTAEFSTLCVSQNRIFRSDPPVIII